MSVPLVDRAPTDAEVELLRLILSTYQDGTGMLDFEGEATTLPGWRDFERSVAAAYYGRAVESKAIFDVLLADPRRNGIYFGLSCKMRETLRVVERTGRATLEISNASGGFWDVLEAKGLDKTSYEQQPDLAGKILIELVERWHTAVDVSNGGRIDTSRSSYLVLQWDKKSADYQLFQFPLRLRTPGTLQWEAIGRRLVGRDERGVLWEWYGRGAAKVLSARQGCSLGIKTVPFRTDQGIG